MNLVSCTERLQSRVFLAEKFSPFRPQRPLVVRRNSTAVVFDPASRTFLVLRWRVGWVTFVTGGIEVDQHAEEAARAEVEEETGYCNLRLIGVLPECESLFYHTPKQVSMRVHMSAFLFVLINKKRGFVRYKEKKIHSAVWVSYAQLLRSLKMKGHRFLLRSVEKQLRASSYVIHLPRT